MFCTWFVFLIWMSCDFVARKDKSCACIVSHTYKQIRRLWELPKDKECVHQNGGVYKQRFDDDMDRSTSSSCGKHVLAQNYFWDRVNRRHINQWRIKVYRDLQLISTINCHYFQIYYSKRVQLNTFDILLICSQSPVAVLAIGYL